MDKVSPSTLPTTVVVFLIHLALLGIFHFKSFAPKNPPSHKIAVNTLVLESSAPPKSSSKAASALPPAPMPKVLETPPPPIMDPVANLSSPVEESSPLAEEHVAEEITAPEVTQEAILEPPPPEPQPIEVKTLPSPAPIKPKAPPKPAAKAVPKAATTSVTKTPPKAAAKKTTPTSPTSNKTTNTKKTASATPGKKPLSSTSKDQMLSLMKKGLSSLDSSQATLTSSSTRSSGSGGSSGGGGIGGSKIGKLGSESLTFSSIELSYADELALYLKHRLHFPDTGKMKISLTLSREGKVVAFTIPSSTSSKNQEIAQKSLHSLSFPSFGERFSGEKNKTFALQLNIEGE